MAKRQIEKIWEKELKHILGILKDIDMKIDYLINRIKYSYVDLNSDNTNGRKN